jgi:hypothetical protein
MNIRWFRPTPEGIEPYAFPVFCVIVALGIVVNVAATALEVVTGSYWPATVSSGCAALNSALLLWGVYRARQQELWRRRIEHDIEASSHSASMLRLQREQLTRDMARYQSATSERRH